MESPKLDIRLDLQYHPIMKKIAARLRGDPYFEFVLRDALLRGPGQIMMKLEIRVADICERLAVLEKRTEEPAFVPTMREIQESIRHISVPRRSTRGNARKRTS
jgi:hypothetical protein